MAQNYLFPLYIYPSDSQESDGGAIHGGTIKQIPLPVPVILKYCCRVEIFLINLLVL